MPDSPSPHAPSTTTTTNEIPYKPGDVVLTKIGVAVITKIISLEEQCQQFRARIWRVPGKSIASSACCFLNFDTILKRLPVAPGMVTKAYASEPKNVEGSEEEVETQNFLFHSYSPQSDTYLACALDKEEKEMKKIKSAWVEQAKCAKFYPLMEELMVRGDAAAATSSSLLSKSNIDSLALQTTEILDKATTSSKDTLLNKENIDAISGKIQSVIPKQEQIQQVYQMMKDEELTELLKKGQERLRQLISDDIPQATNKALQDSGITISVGVSSDPSLTESQSAILVSRENALKALDDLLSEHANINLEELKLTLGNQFTTVFDSLSTAAKSDRYLNSIFDVINEKTAEWQQATGRLLSTKSASLFFEGTQRLQARAASLFSPEQLFQAQKVGMKFTQAFTEGDTAVARLKSIELGDAVRSRLITAIELRSGSKGGLDGIIAEALNSMNADAIGEMAESQMQVMLANLQTTASSAAKDAHETLLATLSQKSAYRDMAILRIEEVFVNLDSQFDLTAEEIVNIAKGENGTAAIFEPIARRATKEIEKQLDLADDYVTDPMAQQVLLRVRKLLSGDLTISGLLGEVENVLNDDQVVAYSERLVQKGETMLDMFENASGNKMMEDFVGIVEKAGITKDSVIDKVQNLDIGKLMDSAEAAVTDEEARREMLSSAGDSALEFLLKILPSLPVPPLDGVNEGLLYHLSNLSMEGFQVKKEDIIVEIAGIRAAKPSGGVDIEILEDGDDEEKDDAASNNKKAVLHRKKSDVSQATSTEDSAFESAYSELSEGIHSVDATELLIIDVKNIAAKMEGIIWGFEQTYFPYLKGSGSAFTELSNGSIRLKFELRRRRVTNDSTKDPFTDEEEIKWEPVLCLHERKCAIGEVRLKLEGGGKVVWIFNKLASFFRGTLRDYVVRSILNILGNKSGVLLKMLNDNLQNYWDIILRTAGLTIDDLAEMSEEDLIEPSKEAHVNEVELVWYEYLPLGMNLLMNDDSGLLKVVDFPRGTQARMVVETRGLDPDVFKGATINAVNGTRYDEETQDELIDALKDPGRPKTVSFELANPEDAERIRHFVEDLDEENEEKVPTVAPVPDKKELSLAIRTVDIADEGPLGIQFCVSADDFALVVEGYSKGESGENLIAEKETDIAIGDILISINGTYVVGDRGLGRTRAVELFEHYGPIRPLSLGFANTYLQVLILNESILGSTKEENPSEEFILAEKKLTTGGSRVILDSIAPVAGKAEKSGVFIGDYLVFVNCIPVGAGCRLMDKVGPRHQLEEVLALLEDPRSFPASLTFARPSVERGRKGILNMETASTVTVTVNDLDELGCEFARGNEHDDIIVGKFSTVRGPVQRSLGNIANWIGMAVESVDGQIVPTYATGKMVTHAIKKSWEEKGIVELLFCEDELRDQLKKFATESAK